MEKLKMLQVKESTHKQIKLKALQEGISIKDYMEKLVNKK